MEHPPYNPELAACNFWLFLCLKSVLWVSRFNTEEAGIVVMNYHFNFYLIERIYKMWVKREERWDKCIVSCGRYLKKEYNIVE